jgi:hypothetical protein
MNSNNWGPIVTAILVIALGGYFLASKNEVKDPVTNVTADTNVKITTVQVSSFYDGTDGYSLSIPSGNTSTCNWTWVAGNGAIPDSKTTYANTATEKHTIYNYGASWDWKVNCTDDFGNLYVGTFPTTPAETGTNTASPSNSTNTDQWNW